jgi:hypothetical protein
MAVPEAARPLIPNADIAVAQRYQRAAQVLRADAAAAASMNDAARAQNLAQAAGAHDARARAIYDGLGRQLRLAQSDPPADFPNAQQAPNGHWYVPSEKRPGQFRMVIC